MKEYKITDSTILTAMLNLLGTMAKQMTGLQPSLALRWKENPDFVVYMLPDESEVKWLDREGREVHVGAFPKESPKSC